MKLFYEMYKMKINDSRVNVKANKEMKFRSSYNDDPGKNGFKPAGGLLKAVTRALFDGLKGKTGLGKVGDEYYSKTLLHDSENEFMICSYNASTQTLRMGICDTTDAIRKFDEKRFAYELLIPLLLKQADENSEIAEAWAEITADVKNKGVLDESLALAKILDSLYYVGKKEINTEYDDVEDLRDYPTNIDNLSSLMIPGNTFVWESDDDTDTTQTPCDSIDSNKTGIEIINELRAEAEELVSEYVSNLSDEDRALIPQESDVAFYLPSEEFIDIVHLIMDGFANKKLYCSNILFWGPPGTGKTSFAIPLAYIFQLPWRFEQGFGSKDVGDYQGTTIAKNGVLETSTETAFVASMVRGGVFVDDDFNYQKEAETTFKNSVLVPPYVAKLADQTEVKRNPFSIYVSTANPHCEGARPITSAFKNRHFIDMEWKPLPDDKLIEYVVAESGYNNKPVVKKMVEAYHAVNEMITDENECVDAVQLTPRNLVYWAMQTRVLKDPVKAANYNLIGALGADVDDTFINTVKTKVLSPRFSKSGGKI